MRCDSLTASSSTGMLPTGYQFSQCSLSQQFQQFSFSIITSPHLGWSTSLWPQFEQLGFSVIASPFQQFCFSVIASPHPLLLECSPLDTSFPNAPCPKSLCRSPCTGLALGSDEGYRKRRQASAPYCRSSSSSACPSSSSNSPLVLLRYTASFFASLCFFASPCFLPLSAFQS